jgi:hypothetical protein
LRTPIAADDIGQAANKLNRQIEPVKVILRRSLGMEVAWLKAPVPRKSVDPRFDFSLPRL